MKPLVRPRSIGGSALVRDYLEEVPAALSFYSGSPFKLSSYKAKLRDVTERFGRDERERVAAAVRPTTENAARRLERFVQEGGAVVTTGQQAGFLTGPLYTVYKALSAVALARHLEERLGVIVLPVFWVASEDHDWDEVNHAELVDRKGRLRSFQLESRDERPLPMSERELEGDLESLCDNIAEAIGGDDNSRVYAKRIIDPYRVAGRTVASAFGEALLGLFRDVDLLLTRADDPAVKRGSLPVLGAALTEAAAHETVLTTRSEAVKSAGYDTQVRILERATNVFYRSNEGRARLYLREEGFGVRGHGVRFDRHEILTHLLEEPGRFSPNVLLRPVVESAVFPTLAYVGGPGETAYFAQASALFGAFGIKPPVVMPRFSGTVVEPAVERVVETLGLRMEDLSEPRETLIDRLARAEVPASVTADLASIRGDLAEGFEKLIEDAGALDPTLALALGGIRNRTLAVTGRAERKIVRSVKRGEAESLQRIDRVLDSLRPRGAAQDRVLNILPYIGRYAGHFLQEVRRAIDEGWHLPEEG